jgi:leucyl-tRNA synthetase
LDWPEKTKSIQSNWIGKSFGAEIDFKSGDATITVFTTRADTLMGATYLVLAPEHPLVDRLTTAKNAARVEAYRDYAAKQSKIERTSTVKEKSGAFTGAYAVHSLSGAQIPIWIADYVLLSYGTGAVMAVPAHDARDFDFAQKYNLPIIKVISNGAERPLDAEMSLPFCDDGMLVNSGAYTGLSSEQARQKISSDLETIGKGKQTVKYRLRDCLVSRQRYWGTPIPIVYCEDCGIVPVPEFELPVKLPYNVAFRPGGDSPLSTCAEFMNTTCPGLRESGQARYRHAGHVRLFLLVFPALL